MTPQTRMLMILGAFGFGGAIALMGMANRYGKLIEQRSARSPRPAAVAGSGWAQDARRPSPAPQGTVEPELADALRSVDGFIEARRELNASIERGMPPAADVGEYELGLLRELRERVTTRLGLTDADYQAVRSRVRSRAGGAAPPNDALSTALELRGRELTATDLGPYERFDL